MQATLVESLMVLVGGTVLGLLLLQSWVGLKGSKPGVTLRTRPATLGIGRSKRIQASESRQDMPKLRSALSRAKKVVPFSTVLSGPTSSSGLDLSLETIQACPSCGLQAPSQLIAEHFLGSPLHRNGKPRVSMDEDGEWKGPLKDPDPAATALLRSLVRLLVPPRAFGLRSQEKSVNPLQGVVQRSSLLENISIGLWPVG